MAKIDNPSTFSLKARLQFPAGVALPPIKKTSLYLRNTQIPISYRAKLFSMPRQRLDRQLDVCKGSGLQLYGLQ
jgi:hypothetical protein